MNSFFDYSFISFGEPGFGRFSFAHLAVLFFGALLTGLLCMYCLPRPRAARSLSRQAALLLFLTELARAALLLSQGLYDRGRLPLHLCTLSVYLCFFHSLCRRPLLGQFLYAFSLPGAAFAMIFPDWAQYPLWHFSSLSSFLIHFLLVLYPLLSLAAGDIRPDIRRLPGCIVLMLCFALPVMAVNSLLGTNYMFLSRPPAGTPLELFAFLGPRAYLLGFIPLALLSWLLLYGKQLMNFRLHLKGLGEIEENSGTNLRNKTS